MRILFDHGTPSGIAKALAGHKVTEAIGMDFLMATSSKWLKQRGSTFCLRPTNEFGISKI